MPEPLRSPSTVFIGSSREGSHIAEAIQVNLGEACDIKPWYHGLFTPSGNALGDLIRVAKTCDCAILVLTPDDLVDSRELASPAPRDNVLFELGLFIGAIGQERTF